MSHNTPLFDPYTDPTDGSWRHRISHRRPCPESIETRLTRWKRREKLRFAVAEAGRRTAKKEGVRTFMVAETEGMEGTPKWLKQ